MTGCLQSVHALRGWTTGVYTGGEFGGTADKRMYRKIKRELDGAQGEAKLKMDDLRQRLSDKCLYVFLMFRRTGATTHQLFQPPQWTAHQSWTSACCRPATVDIARTYLM